MTERQADILYAIVDTYAKTAEPVGSLALSEQFEVSPATVRAEMASLERDGYIHQPHTSAGRVPTDKGYRYYVNSLNERRDMPAAGRTAEVIGRRIRQFDAAEEAIKDAAVMMARRTGNLAFATLPFQTFSYGVSNLLANPEFGQFAGAYQVAQLVDHLEDWAREVLKDDEGRLNVYIGPENPIYRDAGTAAIVANFRSPFREKSHIGLIGPMRQDYRYVISLVDYVGRTLEEVLNA